MNRNAQLKYLIFKAGITQAEVSRKAGIDPSLMSRILHGRRRLRADLATRIAAAIECAVEDIYEAEL